MILCDLHRFSKLLYVKFGQKIERIGEFKQEGIFVYKDIKSLIELFDQHFSNIPLLQNP